MNLPLHAKGNRYDKKQLKRKQLREIKTTKKVNGGKFSFFEWLKLELKYFKRHKEIDGNLY